MKVLSLLYRGKGELANESIFLAVKEFLKGYLEKQEISMFGKEKNPRSHWLQGSESIDLN